MSFLLEQGLWISAPLVVGGTTLVAMTGPILARRRVGVPRLRLNNEVAGFKFAAVGVIYAVLLAFAVIVVWEKFTEAENTVAEEAGAVATLYRLADGIGAEPGAALRRALNGYASVALTEDWPAMQLGKSSHAATRALDNAYTALLTLQPGNARDEVVLAEALRQLDAATHARRQRLVMATGIVPGVLWFVLFAGAALTIGFTFFFGTESLAAQTAMTGVLAFLISSILLVIITIDHPFAGAVRVRPEALSAVLEEFGGETRP